MVSLIERSEYVTKLIESPKFDLFFSLIYGIPSKKKFEIEAEVDGIFQNVIQALIENNAQKFGNSYNQISAREPSKNSPFTNDDLLLFVLLCGIKKFGGDIDWIQKVLNARENSDSEGKLITTTFQNVINQNYQSKDNAFQVIIILENLLSREFISWDEKRIFYHQITTKVFPFFKSEFLSVLSLRSFDLLTMEGDKSDESLLFFLKGFEKRFSKKTRLIATRSYYIIAFGLIILLGWLIFNPRFEPILGKLDILFGLFGLGIFGSFFKRDAVINWIDRQIKSFWGYKSTK